MKDLQVIILSSEKLNGEKAIEEIIEKAKKCKIEPQLILFFSTIHYKKSFKNILRKLKSQFPYGKLAGCTINGFITKDTISVRGMVCIFFHSPYLWITEGIGHNTKRNPQKAARECIKKINTNSLNNINTLLFTITSGPVVPKLPFLNKNFIESKIFGELIVNIGLPLASYLGYGIGREGEIIDEFNKIINNKHYVVGLSSMDDGKMFSTYQFYENKVLTNAVIAIKITTSLPIYLKSRMCGKPSRKEFVITDTGFKNNVIKKINNLPAKTEFLKLLGISDELYKINTGAFYYKVSDYFPLLFKENIGYSSGVGGFYGENILLGYKIRGKHIEILSITGCELIETAKDVLNHFKSHKPKFLFIIASFAYLYILGNKIFKINKEIEKILKNTQYIVIFPVSETVGSPKKHIVHRVYSFNAFSLG